MPKKYVKLILRIHSFMSTAAQKSRIGSLVIRKGLLTQAQLDTALKVQLKTHQRLGEVLIE
jgi:hypothetical protein